MSSADCSGPTPHMTSVHTVSRPPARTWLVSEATAGARQRTVTLGAPVHSGAAAASVSAASTQATAGGSGGSPYVAALIRRRHPGISVACTSGR